MPSCGRILRHQLGISCIYVLCHLSGRILRRQLGIECVKPGGYLPCHPVVVFLHNSLLSSYAPCEGRGVT